MIQKSPSTNKLIIQRLFVPHGFTPELLKNLTPTNLEVVINFMLRKSSQVGLGIRRDDILKIIKEH